MRQRYLGSTSSLRDLIWVVAAITALSAITSFALLGRTHAAEDSEPAAERQPA